MSNLGEIHVIANRNRIEVTVLYKGNQVYSSHVDNMNTGGCGGCTGGKTSKEEELLVKLAGLNKDILKSVLRPVKYGKNCSGPTGALG